LWSDERYETTLTELIANCGDNIFSILNLKNTDGAHQSEVDKGNNWGVMAIGGLFAYGAIPEVAVAELWLLLKEKGKL
jgi:hypothetical protein